MKQLNRMGFLRRYILTALIMMLVAIPVAEAAPSAAKPGNYCPNANILLIVAEDPSSTLEFVMQSRAAQIRKEHLNPQLKHTQRVHFNRYL